MQFLRRSTLIARLVLAWFVLSLGAAVAAPLFTPSNMHQLCTSAGMVVNIVDAQTDDASGLSHPAMKCPLCAPIGAPPPPAALPQGLAPARSHVVPGAPAVVGVAQTAAPLPARGPPLLG